MRPACRLQRGNTENLFSNLYWYNGVQLMGFMVLFSLTEKLSFAQITKARRRRFVLDSCDTLLSTRCKLQVGSYGAGSFRYSDTLFGTVPCGYIVQAMPLSQN